jgi:hypothetical protein
MRDSIWAIMGRGMRNSLIARLGVVAASVSLLGALVFTTGCRQEEEPHFRFATCFDVVEEAGTIHLLYGLPGEGEDEALRFFYTRLEEGGQSWSEPVAIHTAHALPGRHHRGNDPQLAVAGDRLMAVWTAIGGGPWGSGPLATSLSSDGGRSWLPGPAPGEAPVSDEIGFRFPAVAAGADAFHAIWIHAEGEERSLRHARLAFGSGAWAPPSVIDPRICACCWNRLKVGGDGSLYALYRDQEPSDMGFAVSQDDGRTWETRGHAGSYDWRFEGCPHVGGGLAVAGGSVADSPVLLATVWTGHEGHHGAYILRSDDAGRSWEKTANPGGQVWGNRSTDVTFVSPGTAVAVWDEPGEEGERHVLLAHSSDSGLSWSKPGKVSPKGRYSTHPRVVASGGQALVFWSDQEPDGATTLWSAAVALSSPGITTAGLNQRK